MARERAFSILEEMAGGDVEAPLDGLLNVPNFEAQLMARYRATTEGGAEGDDLSPRQMEGELAALVHHDLQLALAAMGSRDANLQRRGVRVASLSNLYARLLPSDPRLSAAIYEGFLLPGASAAPATGWGNKSSLLEGAAVAFRQVGQGERQVQVLRQLLSTQDGVNPLGAGAQGGANSSAADVTRIHLADALASGSFFDSGQKQVEHEKQMTRLGEAIYQLDLVSTPDLLGARSRLPELRQELEALQNISIAQAAAQDPVPALNTGGAPKNGGANSTAANTGALSNGAPITSAPNTNVPNANVPNTGAVPGVGTGGVLGGGMGGNGPRLAQNGGAEGGADAGVEGIDGEGVDDADAARDGAAEDTPNQSTTAKTPDEIEEEKEDALRPGESEKMRRVRRATRAAQKAEALTKKAGQAATISLARMLDAADAQGALEAAEKKRVAQPQNTVRNREAAPRDITALRLEASRAAHAAALASQLSQEAGKAAQKATARAALLALEVHNRVSAETPASPAAIAEEIAPSQLPVAQDATPKAR